MKKKLLTVLLAVVMVFGVFGLTACAPTSNVDADYNYYAVKYELEDEVKINALTYQGVYRMFTTAGEFLLYVDSEKGTDASARFQAINKLANDWDVTIYHFNPELSGGFAADNANAHTTNIIKALDSVAAASQLKAVQDNLTAISGKTATEWTDNALYGIKGAAPTVASNGTDLKYNGKIQSINSGADAYKSILPFATKRPSFGAYTEEARDIPYVGQAYITYVNTLNLFADSRLHMYQDEEGADINAFTAEKEDLYVTVANYAMFAHLIDNNDGYFPVFFGGTWCGNTQAIVKLTNEVAAEKGIKKIYFFDPRLEDGTTVWSVKNGVATINGGSYLAKNLNTRTDDGTGSSYNFNFLYGKFLADYLPEYRSEWNIKTDMNDPTSAERFITITVDGVATKFTRMCVPNIMMFDGSGKGAEIVALAEAEYSWGQTSVEGTEQHDAWKAAVESVFDANPWLATELAEQQAAGGSSEGGSSEGAGSGSGSGSGTTPPAEDAGGGC